MLLRETVVRAKSLPVSDQAIQKAILKVRSNFLPIAIEDAIWLDQIEKLRTAALPSNKPEDASRLTRFLDTHFVLYLTNGEEWYDIHPLIRSSATKRRKSSNVTRRSLKNRNDRSLAQQALSARPALQPR